MQYKDITNQITIIDSGLVSNLSAYAENGIVLIYVTLREGKHGSLIVAKVDELYAPRQRINGSYSSINTGADSQKLAASFIDSNGDMRIWLSDDLVYNEYVTFVYPLRRIT